MKLLNAVNISKSFKTTKSSHEVRALDNVSFHLNAGETLGLVGESGSGKSTLAKVLMGLVSSDNGRIEFENEEVYLGQKRPNESFSRQVQMIFQNPSNALNPRMKIKDAILEPLIIHRVGTTESRKELLKELMAQVGLDIGLMDRQPHMLSGGEKQRVCIAKALALKPKVIICDEAVSSLDVLIRQRILDLFKELQEKYNLTYLFITHDLRVVRYISSRLLVMQKGKVIEEGSTRKIFGNPQNDYTRKLLSSIDLDDI